MNIENWGQNLGRAGAGVAIATVTLLGLTSEAVAQALTIYSGRGESLIGPLIEQAEADLGFEIEVRYGDTAELAVAIIEEGNNSPADIFFGQDAGALGALQREGRTATIPTSIVEQVDERFASPTGQWLGITGRSRVVNYNTDNVDPADLPTSIFGFADPEWNGRIGWAPTNGSFQAFVTAMRLTEGEDRAKEWLEAVQANNPQVYRNNTTAVEGVARGEVDVAFVNNYYLYRFLAEDPDFPVGQHSTIGDAGTMVNVAGVAIIDTSDQQDEAAAFIEYLLTPAAQTFFLEETREYPLVDGAEAPEGQLPIDELNPPNIDLADLSDLEGTLELLNEVGLL